QLLGSGRRHADVFETEPRGGVEVEPKLVGMVDVVGPHRPGMEIQASQLDQANHVRLALGYVHPPGTLGRETDFDGVERRVLGGPLVIDGILAHPVHVALEHRRAIGDAAGGPFCHGHEVVDDVELRPALFGENDPIGRRDAHLLATDLDLYFLLGHPLSLPAFVSPSARLAQATSNNPAAPWPPPTHIVTTPYRPPRRFSSRRM